METEVSCPFCGEDFTIVLDPSIEGEQDYIEDCYVCCKPIRFAIEFEDGELLSLHSARD